MSKHKLEKSLKLSSRLARICFIIVLFIFNIVEIIQHLKILLSLSKNNYSLRMVMKQSILCGLPRLLDKGAPTEMKARNDKKQALGFSKDC